MSGTSRDHLPPNQKEWEKEVAGMNLEGKSVHAAELASASKIGYSQFLLLRVLWIVHDIKPSLPNEITEFLPKAVKMLKGYPSWATYCGSFDKPKAPEGNFAVARQYQKMVEHSNGKIRPTTFDTPVAHNTRKRLKDKVLSGISRLQLNPPETPSRSPIKRPQTPTLTSTDDDLTDDDSVVDDEGPTASSPITPAADVPEDLRRLMFPPTKDEQIVNTALVIFLNALTIHFDIFGTCNWTMHRKSFIANFKEASFEARTDGYLDDGQENAYALIEVKPIIRSAKQSAIQMQESAQMVGWIMNDTGGNNVNKLRVHVSQDRHEIFITFAEYDDDYLAYLTNQNPKKATLSFLTMHQYGPWNTQSSRDMAELGPILLAISLYAEAQIKKTTNS